MAPKPTLQDDYMRLIHILSGAPLGGLSIEDIHNETAKTDDTWSYRTINNLLVGLGSKLSHAKVRGNGGKKVTRYELRNQTS